MLEIVSIIIWAALGYISGWADCDEGNAHGLLRMIAYILMMIIAIISIKIFGDKL